MSVEKPSSPETNATIIEVYIDEAASTTKNSSKSASSIDEENMFDIDEKGLLIFKENCPLKTRNWPLKTKLLYTILYSLVTFAAQFNSTTTSSGFFEEKMRDNFHISREVSLLTISLYILGIAFGPMIFAPLSEIYGRKMCVLIPFFISSVFIFATAISYNVPSLMVCRFLSGFFAGAPIVSAGGVLADLWDPTYRGAAFALYACFVANGASFGPIISSLLINSNKSEQSWRIPQWFGGLCELVMFLLMYIFTKETYEPIVIFKLAKNKRIQTENWNIHCKLDTMNFNWREILKTHVIRPFVMLKIPIVLTMAVFASYVYGLFYLMITNISTAFVLSHGWEGTISDLPNITLFFGVFIGCIGNMVWALKYAKIIHKNNGQAIPEQRLPIMMMLGWCMPIGIFIFGWTSSPNIHWIVPCIGILLIGCGFITIFQGCLNYLVDTYPRYAASAIAANTFTRSVSAASFPLFARQLFVNLGVHWGSSLIGFIALGMVPIPYVLYLFAEKIRTGKVDPFAGGW